MHPALPLLQQLGDEPAGHLFPAHRTPMTVIGGGVGVVKCLLETRLTVDVAARSDHRMPDCILAFARLIRIHRVPLAHWALCDIVTVAHVIVSACLTNFHQH